MKREKNLQTSRRVISFVVIIVLALFFFLMLVLIFSGHNTLVSRDTTQQTDDIGEEGEELPATAPSAAGAVAEDDGRLQISASEEPEEEISVPAEPEETDSGRSRWQVYIQPDMPEPFTEVFEQYEEFLNADNQDLNDRSVGDKIFKADGEWRYLHYELCGNLQRQYFEEDGPEDCIRYSLTDLTGDGFPELIMGDYSDYSDETFPEVVYYYSKTEGIKMECRSRYYTMTLYEGGIIEYGSGGVNYTITYLQFRQDTEEWIVIDRFWVMNEEAVRGGPIYYREGDEERFLDEPEYPITEEEFKHITDGYTQKPVEPEWTPLTPGSESAAIH